MLTRLFLLCSLLLAPLAEAANPAGFLFVTFRGGSTALDEQIYFALSRDGLQWENLRGGRPVLVSGIGDKGARDPYLLRGEDGKFRLLATDLSMFHTKEWKDAAQKGSRSILLWESDDLVTWSEPRLVPVAPPEAGCAWAPEAIFDTASRRYLLYWASTSAQDKFSKFRILGAWTTDFRNFGEPFVYIEKPATIIDTDIILGDEGKYYRFTKDEKEKSITMEVSEAVTGSWREVPGFSLAGLKGYEGPTCFRLRAAEDGRPAVWGLLLDAYTKGTGYQPYLSTDLAGGDFQAAAGFSFPFRLRHGSVLALSAEEYARVQAAYGEAAPGGAPASPSPAP